MLILVVEVVIGDEHICNMQGEYSSMPVNGSHNYAKYSNSVLNNTILQLNIGAISPNIDAISPLLSVSI